MVFKMDYYRHTAAVIHLDHLSSNFRLLKKIAGDNNFLCPMVKANAYGHGDIEICRKLEKEGVRTLGVGLVEEGILLRQMGIKSEILVFGIFDQTAVKEVIHWQLTPVISIWSQLQILSDLDFDKKLSVHIKFDTGMHRLGFSIDDAEKIYDHIKLHKNLKVTGVCTHLFSGEDAGNTSGESFQQLKKFRAIEKIFSSPDRVTHSLNSAGALNFYLHKKINSKLPFDISLQQGIRPGLLLYGISPLEVLPEELDFRPVMSLRSHVVKYHRINVGESVSYGATWQARRKSIVGVVPIGYADGYHRLLSNKAEVLVKGKRVPVVGNVCMDYILVDVTDVILDREVAHNLEVEVTLFGYDSLGNLLSPKELALKAMTIPWEILTSVGERVPRILEEKNSVSSVISSEAET